MLSTPRVNLFRGQLLAPFFGPLLVVCCLLILAGGATLAPTPTPAKSSSLKMGA